MAEQINLNIDNYTVYSYHSDYRQQLNLVSLFNFLQESAWSHASKNAFGFDDLLNQGFFWALTRVKFTINKYPKWGDNLRIETWSKEPDPLIAYRDFEIFNETNEKLLAATTAWLIVDIKSRRPQRMAPFKDKFPHLHTRYAINEHPGKLPELPNENLTTSTKREICLSDMDMNGHVNNANYVRWVIDTFSFDFIKSHSVTEMEINFLHESQAGQHYIVNIHEKNNLQYLCNVVRTDDNKELARMEIFFKEE